MKGYKVKVLVYSRDPVPMRDIYYEDYTGKIHTDELSAHEELWLAQHDGEVMDSYVEEVDL